MDPFTRISPEAAKDLEGKVLPVTIEVNGEKRVIGVGVLHTADGGIKIDTKITDPAIVELLKPDLTYFSMLPGGVQAVKPLDPPSKWKEGLSNGGD